MFMQYFKNLNFKVLVLIIILFIVSVFMILSATDANFDHLNRFIKIQSLAFVIGIFTMLFMILIDYKMIGNFSWGIYIISIILLLSVYIPGLGIVRNNARSWINLGPIDLQTSELTKLGFIIVLAKYLSKEDRKLEKIKDLIIPFLIVMPIVLLLLKQPDLGSALVFVVIFIGMLFMAELDLKLFATGVISMLILMPISYNFLKPHQKLRIDAFLKPNDSTLPGYYHVMQSKITIGSGEVFGKGIFKGIYHKYNYLPVRESDFIYAVIGEELGFVGTVFIILIYFALLYQLLIMGSMSKDKFGGLIIYGVMFMFAFQIFENIGMTIGLMPVTGITLPFVSYGGSSMVTNFIAIGMVFSVYVRRMRYSEMN
jgi:rod shape determining protein RodA